MWNRLGNVAGKVPVDDRDVDFLPVTKALHDAGFHVLLFDLRRHGESEPAAATCHLRPDRGARLRRRRELPALARRRRRPAHRRARHLDGRQHRAPRRARLPADQGAPRLPAVDRADLQRQLLRATSSASSAPLLVGAVELIYRLGAARRRAASTRATRRKRLDGTIVHYAQGTGDSWGTMADVESMHAGTPTPDGPVEHFPSTGRYDGYRYVSERDATRSPTFFTAQPLGARASASAGRRRTRRPAAPCACP